MGGQAHRRAQPVARHEVAQLQRLPDVGEEEQRFERRGRELAVEAAIGGAEPDQAADQREVADIRGSDHALPVTPKVSFPAVRMVRIALPFGARRVGAPRGPVSLRG